MFGGAGFHRNVWQRLPRRLRRQALFALAGTTPTAPDDQARPAEPIVVVAALRSATGLGQSARLCYRALEAGGLDVRGVDLSSAFAQAIDFPDFQFKDGRSALGRGTLILHVNAPFMAYALWTLGRRLVRDKF